MIRKFSAALLATVAVAAASDAAPKPIRYADLCAKVVAGQTVKVTVGGPATGDRVAISDAPAAVPPGDYTCRYDGVGQVLWVSDAPAAVVVGGGCPGGVCPVRR